ncbi:MAG: HAD family hydrolase [Microbacterium sp.]
MTRRIVFLDIDGTIVQDDGTIPASTIEAMRGARDNGHLVLMATGRSPLEIDPRLDDLGLDGMIASAGAFVQFGGEWVIEHPMTESRVDQLVAAFERLGMEYVLQARDAIHPTQGVIDSMRAFIRQSGYDEGGAHAKKGMSLYLGDFGEPNRAGVAKAVFFGADASAYDRVRHALGGDFHVVTGTIPLMGTASGEVSAPGITKGSAILELLDLIGMDVADSIAIGDNNNDLEMLATVGIGIAMGNGTELAKNAADEVTSAIDDDGIHRAFARHGLI